MGSAVKIERFFKPIVSSEKVVGFALSEPDVASNISAIKPRRPKSMVAISKLDK